MILRALRAKKARVKVALLAGTIFANVWALLTSRPGEDSLATKNSGHSASSSVTPSSVLHSHQRDLRMDKKQRDPDVMVRVPLSILADRGFRGMDLPEEFCDEVLSRFALTADEYELVCDAFYRALEQVRNAQSEAVSIVADVVNIAAVNPKTLDEIVSTLRSELREVIRNGQPDDILKCIELSPWIRAANNSYEVRTRNEQGVLVYCQKTIEGTAESNAEYITGSPEIGAFIGLQGHILESLEE